MNLLNLILNTDSYKPSHWPQYPPKTKYVHTYIESRGGKYDFTEFFGLQMFLKEYLTKPITQQDIDEAEAFLTAHGEPFNRAGWQYILEKHAGYLPLRIKAVAEGTCVPTHNALVTVENTDPECYWLPSYVETALLRAVWYPTTVATNSRSIKRIIQKFLEKTADEAAMAGLPFKLHDFGARGVSSFESAGIGGASHLVNFMGSDTITGALYAKRYYNEPGMVSYSVPAAEHSSITSWTRDGELDAYRNMLTQFGGKYPIISVVSDSYDIFNAAGHLWGEKLKDEVIKSGSMLVIRPDSGDPAKVVLKLCLILDSKFGHTMNSKGFRVLNNVRILQGDGINEESITEILTTIMGFGFSTDNVVFGMGGALLQGINRDTQKFAMKASAAYVNDHWVDVYKDPVTDDVKKSKKGRQMLYRGDVSGKFVTTNDGLSVQVGSEIMVPMLDTVFENGKVVKEFTFSEVRANAEK